MLASSEPLDFGEAVTLDVGWMTGSPTEQLVAEFALSGGEWQPVELFGKRTSSTSASDPPSFSETDEESNGALTVSLNAEQMFVLTGTGQRVLGVNFLSDEAGLVVGSDPRPFEVFVANRPEQVTLGTFGTLITIDGDLTLDVGWNPEVGLEHLVVEYGNESGEAVVAELSSLPFEEEGGRRQRN